MKKQVLPNDKKLKGEVQSKHNHDIKCFKCHGLRHYALECANHQVIILKDDGEIVSTSEESDCDDMPPLEDASDLEYVVGDKVLEGRSVFRLRRMMWSNKGRTYSILNT